MKFVRIAVLLFLLLPGLAAAQSAGGGGQSDSDSRLCQKLVGTWLLEHRSTNGVFLSRTETIHPDGTLVATGYGAFGTNVANFRYEANWRVHNGLFGAKVTKTDSPITPLGTVFLDKMVSVDDSKCVYQTMEGETVTCSRKK